MAAMPLAAVSTTMGSGATESQLPAPPKILLVEVDNVFGGTRCEERFDFEASLV
jgi:hypothetical protein